MTEDTKKTIGKVGLGVAAAGAAVAIIAGLSAEAVNSAVTISVGIATGIGALIAAIWKK